jgi:hypothetical protein
MKNHTWVTIYVIVLAMMFFPREGFSMTGEQLIDYCQSLEKDISDNSTKTLVCLAYVSGITHAINNVLTVTDYAITLEEKEKRGVVGLKSLKNVFCRKIDDVTIKQLALILIKYLKNKPEVLHLGVSGPLSDVLRKKFPCEND